MDHAITDTVSARLQTIWASVLKQEIAADANFFEMGGNSIQLISMLLHVNQSFGLEVSLDEFAREASIMHLAQCIEREMASRETPGTVMTGSQVNTADTQPLASTGQDAQVQMLPLLPVQYWFLRRPSLNHYNVGYLYEVPPGHDPALLQQAFAAVIARHEGLRILLRQAADGAWQQALQAPQHMAPWWHVLDLAAIGQAQLASAITDYCNRFQASLDVSRNTLAIVHFDLGPGRGARLLVLFHHILLDNICERIVWHDVESAYRQLQQGQPVQLRASGRSIADWSHTLLEYAHTRASEHLAYWLGLRWEDYRPLPVEPLAMVPTSQATLQPAMEQTLQPPFGAALQPRPPAGQGLERLAFAARQLSAATTDKLLTLQHGAGIDASVVVMAAMALAFRDWCGSSVLALATIHNGRVYHTIPQANVLNTVGWLVNFSIFPIHIRPAMSGRVLLDAIVRQAAQLRDDSLSYTCLKHMHPDPAVRQAMAALPDYHLGFNFIPFRADTASPFMFATASESAGDNEKWFDPDIKPFINVFFANNQLSLSMGYSPCMYSEATIGGFLQQVIRHIANIVHEQ